ncbi:hypothetical protein MASR2M70_11620 [Bacillota bacterium]
MEYITIKQAASKWDLGVRQVQNYCKNSAIEGVIRFNGVWAIPENAHKPTDGRRRQMKNTPVKDREIFRHINDQLEVFRKVFDLFPYRLNITDTEGFMVYGNDAFFEGTLPKVRDTAIGSYNILREPLLGKWGLAEHVRRAFRGERVYTPALRFPNRDLVGSIYSGDLAFFTLYNDVNSFPVFAEDGRLRYVVTVYIPVREYRARDEVMRAKEYIEANWTEPFSTKQAARTAHLSITSFVQLFRKETGMTPHEYYTQVKMTRLRDMLLNGSLSIVQAFNACGMDYNSYYASLFKKHIGLTPKQFREKNE